MCSISPSLDFAMTRLQTEWQRLYLPRAPVRHGADADAPSLIDADGCVRAMLLEIARPAEWGAVSKVWQGVQADLALPAPAIAVTGTDGYQLWFSLAEPLPVPQAMAFLDLLREHYLSHIGTERVGLMPTVDPSSAPFKALHASRVPAQQAQTGHWSAFVAPDLAPVFAETPWLDMPPSEEGQSTLLSHLESIKHADFQRALAQLIRPAEPARARSSASLPASMQAVVAGSCTDPRRFLLDVMNNDAVALGLRIEAAKALLPYFRQGDNTAFE